MNSTKFAVLAATTVVVLGAGVWLSMHRSSEQGDLGGGAVFADLKPALSELTEVRLAKGDGSRTTLRKGADGWTVVERQYPADAGRVRELALNLASLKLIERKTSNPAYYAKLGVEAPDSPTAEGTLVELVAGAKTWSLIVGKGAEGRAIYVRKPTEAASLLVEPSIAADPDQKRWIDRAFTDVPGASVHEVAVKTASGPAYLLTRATRGAPDLTLTPIPKGRKPVTSMSLASQTDALQSFTFDDVRAAPSPAAPATDTATYRTFDGQILELSGHREGEKAFLTVATHRDAELAAKFAEAAPKPATPPAPANPANETLEKLGARAKGLEFEVPAYKYDAIFRKPEDLLEKVAAPVKPAK